MNACGSGSGKTLVKLGNVYVNDVVTVTIINAKFADVAAIELGLNSTACLTTTGTTITNKRRYVGYVDVEFQVTVQYRTVAEGGYLTPELLLSTLSNSNIVSQLAKAFPGQFFTSASVSASEVATNGVDNSGTTGSDNNNLGTIVGASVGGACVLALVVFLMLKKRSSAAKNSSRKSHPAGPNVNLNLYEDLATNEAGGDYTIPAKVDMHYVPLQKSASVRSVNMANLGLDGMDSSADTEETVSLGPDGFVFGKKDGSGKNAMDSEPTYQDAGADYRMSSDYQLANTVNGGDSQLDENVPRRSTMLSTFEIAEQDDAGYDVADGKVNEYETPIPYSANIAEHAM